MRFEGCREVPKNDGGAGGRGATGGVVELPSPQKIFDP